MKLAFGLISLVLFFAPAAAQNANSNKSPSEIAHQQSQAVVIVESLDDRGSIIGQGSGFIVTPSGAVVSNLHVVQGAAMVRVKLPNGDAYKTADLVDVDDAKDIAILKIKGFKLPTVTLGDSDKAEVGDPVVVISSPEGLINSLTTGVISGVRRLDTHRVFQITAPISPGSSGGALFNADGEIIGIVTYLLKSGQNINFAVPINYARGMISDQVTLSLARLQPAPPAPAQRDAEKKPLDVYDTDEPIQNQVTLATRGKLGRTPQEPVFTRPDEALALFYRLVEGIGISTSKEAAELMRTAALVKTKDASDAEEYTIQYLSYYTGLKLRFTRPDHLLDGVELLVTWSVEDLKNTFGTKFKTRTVGGQKILDFGRQPTGQHLTAMLDGNGNVRAVRFSKPK